MNVPFLIAVIISLAGLTAAKNDTNLREKKSFQFLTVIKFPNDVCGASNSKNGTCYTPDECLQKGGVSSGSCANGYGVCCVFTLQCGKSTSENNTYLVLGATATTPSPSTCTYTICPNNPNVCRIKLDFSTFSIVGPVTGQVKTAGGPAADVVTGGAIGDCITDQFSVGSPGNIGTPVICGLNSNTHIFVEASQLCNTAVFNFGATAFTRQYDIKVTQYSCQDEMGGPSDCLQFFTGNTGTIQSFNFQTKTNQVSSVTTHLSSQCYTICFRRNLNKCGICFVPAIAGSTAVINQASFGLSVSMTPSAEVDAACSTDYLIIPNGQVGAAPFNPQTTVQIGAAHRFCGRYLGVGGMNSNANSLCTFMRPFRVIFKSDANEVATGQTAITNEQINAPGGIIGFQLNFNQISC